VILNTNPPNFYEVGDLAISKTLAKNFTGLAIL